MWLIRVDADSIFSNVAMLNVVKRPLRLPLMCLSKFLPFKDYQTQSLQIMKDYQTQSLQIMEPSLYDANLNSLARNFTFGMSLLRCSILLLIAKHKDLSKPLKKVTPKTMGREESSWLLFVLLWLAIEPHHTLG